MADVWTNSMACHLRATCHIVGPGEFIGMSSRATYHIAGCYHLVNSMSRFQSHMPHCRVESPGEINVMIVPHCSVQEFHQPYWKSFFTIFNFYGRPLSVSGRPCYILPMFFLIYLFIFYGRLILRPWLTEVRESFTRGGPWVSLEKLLLGFFPGHP